MTKGTGRLRRRRASPSAAAGGDDLEPVAAPEPVRAALRAEDGLAVGAVADEAGARARRAAGDAGRRRRGALAQERGDDPVGQHLERFPDAVAAAPSAGAAAAADDLVAA